MVAVGGGDVVGVVEEWWWQRCGGGGGDGCGMVVVVAATTLWWWWRRGDGGGGGSGGGVVAATAMAAAVVAAALWWWWWWRRGIFDSRGVGPEELVQEEGEMLPTVSRGRTPSHVRSSSNPVFPQYLRRIVKVPLSQRLLSPPIYPHAFVIDGKGREGEQPKYGWHDQFEPWQQMDIEYTFWQMLHLCTSPKIVYVYLTGIVVLCCHSETKNQWARDDPAFIVVCSLLLVVSTLAYCVAYDHSTAHAVFVIISVLLFHFYLTGVVVATCCWFLTNNYLREEAPNSHVVEQRVEWQVQKLCTFQV
ncbi:hypothetical protein RHGRI_032624 [Rhododendron griersonianum]|uniref:Uncharacterized protein n=1 Tax=Rhododendron griersonianum TaxID=479676 RepID=A0AAV6ID60_9ERIC|nr:hypothetical protein RHGRI_032624 [Rhododendron griersonianum]KAG5526403.1 hypothetical protein RHGRI_032624 [Rhododendron griersonianum]KAG5526404.1 hypothetical protein RHGRI_032624 [Rhododendron griersonianum]